jgi:hypothetical protein
MLDLGAHFGRLSGSVIEKTSLYIGPINLSLQEDDIIMMLRMWNSSKNSATD